MTAIRDFFPNMPDEVFDSWISPLAQHYGWPFTSTADQYIDTKWHFIFANFSFKRWHSFSWDIISGPLMSSPFASETKFRVLSIIQDCVENKQTATSSVFNSKGRFFSCLSYIQEHGDVPIPPVGFLQNGQLEILDGHHRIAALIHAKVSPDFLLRVWVPHD